MENKFNCSQNVLTFCDVESHATPHHLIKKVAVIPPLGITFNEFFQKKAINMSEKSLQNPFHLVKQLLENKNILLTDKHLIDDSYIGVLHFDIDFILLQQKPDLIHIYIACEPKTVVYMNGNPKQLKGAFDYILTLYNDQADNQVIYKFNYPQYIPKERNNKANEFEEKKLLVNISSNKHSFAKNSLYRYRKKVIQFFEKNYPAQFDLFGSGWPLSWKTYKGKADCKIECMKNYKFAICFENETNCQGYITEKIFDCFLSGCVPIYLGADNILAYIPENCFINMKDFKSFSELYNFISGISKEKYNEYLWQINAFLQSDQINKFEAENMTSILSNLLNQQVRIRKKRSIFKMKMLKISSALLFKIAHEVNY